MTDAQQYLVTGASGFVGRRVVAALLDGGARVVAFDRDPIPAPPDQEPGQKSGQNLRTIRGDLRDTDSLAAAAAGCDAIVHLASVVRVLRAGRAELRAINIGGIDNALAAGRRCGVRRFVYVSSASVVYEGRDIENGDESLPYTAVSQAPYADSKIAAERDVIAANGKAGMLTCSLRPHVIFGPGDGRFLPAILRRAKAGALRLGVGTENKLSDFTYIDNLIDALVLADKKLATEDGASLGGKVWFITNGEPLPFWDFVDQVLVESGLPRIRARIPYRIAYAAATVAEKVNSLLGTGDGPENGFTRFAIRYLCTHHYFSIERARRDLGYSPAVSITEGIRRTVESLRQSGDLPR